MSGCCKINYNKNVSQNKTMSILIVDDEIDVAEALKEYLCYRGHDVQIQNEGSRGLGQISVNDYDMIFMDYHLKNDVISDTDSFDGILMTDVIKTNFNKKNLIFAYTGDSDNDLVKKFKEVGMDGVIFKPIDVKYLDKLMSVIETNANSLHTMKKSSSVIVF